MGGCWWSHALHVPWPGTLLSLQHPQAPDQLLAARWGHQDPAGNTVHGPLPRLCLLFWVALELPHFVTFPNLELWLFLPSNCLLHCCMLEKACTESEHLCECRDIFRGPLSPSPHPEQATSQVAPTFQLHFSAEILFPTDNCGKRGCFEATNS